jgi:hypothetical protein
MEIGKVLHNNCSVLSFPPNITINLGSGGGKKFFVCKIQDGGR